MAVVDLSPFEHAEVALGANFQAYKARGVRNALITCNQDFYLNIGMTDLDGVAPAAGNRVLVKAGTYSIRWPGSGAGDQAHTEDGFIHAASSGAGGTFYIVASPDNVAR